MNYNFSSFAKTVKRFCNLKIHDLVSELLSCGIERFDSVLDKGNASNYYNCKKKIPTFFIDYSRTENGKNEIIDFFVNDFFLNIFLKMKVIYL